MNRRRIFRTILIALALILIVGFAGIALWLQPLAATPDANQALVSSNSITVTTTDSLITFMPAAPKAGFVFYPGAKVDPVAYAPEMRAIAEHGYATFIVKMPVNMAIFGVYRAADIISANPGIKRWAVGGHSLGGAMACQFVASRADISGLILYASYPDPGTDLSKRDTLKVVSISGTRDGLATPDKINAAKRLLPPDATFIAIEGGNHAYFGSYGPQDGDNTATISHDEAFRQIVAGTVALLDKITG